MNEKSIFNFRIQYKDGTSIDLHEDKNIWVSSFRILSPTPEHVTERIDGRHGSVLLGTTLLERKIRASFSVEGYDHLDFDLLRDELFRIFNPLQTFYIIRDLQPGKRMEVAVYDDFDLKYITLEDGEFELDFVIHSTFLESTGTTLDPFTFESDKWQIGQGIPMDLEIKYSHNTTTFPIYNAGDVMVDPRSMPLLITFKGPSTNLTIKNLTTGDIWSYMSTTTSSDVIKLDGIRSLKNDVSVLKDTNKKLISIAPGIPNDFEVIGTTGAFIIDFEFRFYYL
jgi:phage-related protein